MSNSFSHLDANDNPSMVDVGDKKVTKRSATARALVFLPKEVMQQLEGEDMQTKKGPVFQTAILAGIMGAKKTSDLIPLCHPLALNKCKVDIRVFDQNHIQIDCTATVDGKTGVEMEALTGASIAALTVYDMCKAFTHDMRIVEVKLMSKEGGKRDFSRP